jgi:hypothetical protein
MTITQTYWAKSKEEAIASFTQGLGKRGYTFLKINKGGRVNAPDFSDLTRYFIRMDTPATNAEADADFNTEYCSSCRKYHKKPVWPNCN